MITLFLFASALIGQGLGYGNISLFHPMLVVSLKDFKFSNFIAFCKENKPLIFMAIYSALSILWATSARIGARELSLILMGEAVVFFVVYSKVKAYQLFKVLKIVMAANLIISVGESLKIFRYPFSSLSPHAPLFARKFVTILESVPTGFHYNPNNNALFILMFSPIMIAILGKKWSVLYLIVASFVIFMATSKLILVGWLLFLIILLFGILFRKLGPAKAIASMTGATLLIGTLLFFSSGSRLAKYQKTIPSLVTYAKETPILIYSRLMGEDVKIESRKGYNSLHERLLLLDGVAKVLSEHWLWGIGGGSLEPIMHTQDGRTMSLRMPHFYFLELFAKYGIFFVGAYLFWLVMLFKRVTVINKLYGLSLVLFVLFSPVMSSAIYFLPKWGLYSLLLKISKEKIINSSEYEAIA